jgi:periplasmic protein TonB
MAAVAASNPYFRRYDLPGGRNSAQEQRFRRLTLKSVVAVTVLALIVPWLPVPERAVDTVEEIPPRLARFVLEREPIPPPPPPVLREEPRPVEPEVVPPRPPEQRRPEPPQPQPQPQPSRTEVARERAAASGVLPMAQELAALRDSAALSSVLAAETTAGAAEARRAERAMITSRAGQSSGGITTGDLSRGTGGEGLVGRTATSVDSPVAGMVAEAAENRAGAAISRPRAAARRSSGCSTRTRARSMRSTVARCVPTRRCRARWCCA